MSKVLETIAFLHMPVSMTPSLLRFPPKTFHQSCLLLLRHSVRVVVAHYFLYFFYTRSTGASSLFLYQNYRAKNEKLFGGLMSLSGLGKNT